MCKVCKTNCENPETLEAHIRTHSINCEKCAFKTDTSQLLVHHMNLNHKETTPMKCSFCPATFIEKKNIYAHRKQYHYSFKACININNCSFKDLCSFNHNPITEGASICYQCGNEFLNINDLMVHKKNDHKKELCTKFQIGKCTKNPCWYTHEMSQQTQAPKQTQGFWQVQSNPVPPTVGWQQQTPTKLNNVTKKDPMMSQILEMMKLQQLQITQMNQALQALASKESTETV